MSNVIRIAYSLDNLTGQGLEYLVREDGTVAAKFVDGNIMTVVAIDSQSPTLIAA